MKRMFTTGTAILLFVLCLFLSGCSEPGVAPPTNPTPAPFSTIWLTESSILELDLDGNGVPENLAIEYCSPNVYDGWWQIKVQWADGTEEKQRLEADLFDRTIITDLDPTDGYLDIIISYDYASDDYYFCAFRVNEHRLVQSNEKYGMVTDVQNGDIRVIGHVDALGTWTAFRTYNADASLIIQPIGQWQIATPDKCLAERPVTVLTEVAVEWMQEDGSYAPGTLKKGTELVPVQTDGNEVLFQTADGQQGRLTIDRDEQNWRITINGQDEEMVFDNLQYAG